MAVQPGVWGIDLGQCALKALRLDLVDGQVTATAFDYVEHPKILSQPDADPDQLTREALEKFLSRNALKGDIVAISVPGQSGLARFVKLPPVEEKKIGDIVKFEAKQQIPFNLDEVVWDYQKVSSGVVTDGFALETEIGLFAMKRDMVNRYLQHFKDVNVEVHVVQMAPLCLCNYVAYDLLNVGADTEAAPEPAGRKQCVVALDIGADSSNLIVTDGRRIIWQRPIPLGGNHFTRALTKDLKLTFAKAEHLKRNATKSGPELKKILTALKPVLNDFAGEVQRSLGYFTNTHRDAQIEYMMGLGSAFRLPGLQRFLSEKLQLDVRKLQKLERLSGEAVTSAPAFTENVLSFAVAYGLAIQGLKVARLHTNLLPPEIRVERLVRAKKPWAAAAAAALLLGTAGLAWSYALEYRSVDIERAPLKPAIAEADSAIQQVNGEKTKFDNQKKEADKEEQAVRSIIAGQDEKVDWLALNKFIASAIPRPDGRNLPAPRATDLYWKNGKAHQAFEKYQYLITHPKAGQRLDTSDVDHDLIQFNIESLDARYTDDLAGYWTRVKAKLGDEKYRVRPASDWDNAPKDKEAGWVVELRGYTYHDDGRNFTLEGLVEALARAGAAEAPADGASGATPTAPGTPAKPASPTPAAVTATAGATKPLVAPGSHPVKGRVSHFVLYRAESGGADLRHSGFVASLVGGGAGGGGEPGPGGKMMAPGGGAMGPAGGGSSGGMPSMAAMGGGGGGTGGSRGSWTALINSPSGESGTGTGGGYPGLGTALPGSTGMPRGSGGGPPAPPSMGGRGPGGDTKPAQGEKPLAAQPIRTEFVVLFIWEENTPSDSLRVMTPLPAADASGTGGLGGGAGMPSMGGAGAPGSDARK